MCPKHSVLGLLFFRLYINDIVTAIHHATINLFADDTTSDGLWGKLYGLYIKMVEIQ
jgi:hypothetical protein